jgi:hypothetical protein
MENISSGQKNSQDLFNLGLDGLRKKQVSNAIAGNIPMEGRDVPGLPKTPEGFHSHEPKN